MMNKPIINYLWNALLVLTIIFNAHDLYYTHTLSSAFFLGLSIGWLWDNFEAWVNKLKISEGIKND
jgi:hypothetical protein